MKRLFCALAIAVLSAAAVGAPPLQSGAPADAAKRADILKLVKMTHSLDLGLRIGTMFSDQIVKTLRRSHPDISEVAIRDIEQAASDIIDRPSTRAKLTNAIVRLYAKYYTDADIRGMIHFYGTPLGRKILRVRPRLSKEAFQAGEAVFAPMRGELIDRIRLYLQRDHIDLKTLRPDESGKPSKGTQAGPK